MRKANGILHIVISTAATVAAQGKKENTATPAAAGHIAGERS